MSYFLAASLVSLRNEINAANPGRDKTSDGWIGDASHQARVSDHNPDYAAGGIVRAIDVDVDGCPPDHLIAVAIRDPRVEYVISRRKIYERQRGFVPIAYNGTNPHDHHTHISIRHTAAAAAAGPWGYSSAAPAPAPRPAPGRGNVYDVAKQVIAGQWGNMPERQTKLQAAGYNYEQVRTEVNRILAGGGPPPVVAKKSVTDVAREVIAGQWGNNPTRSQRLQAAGFSPTAVQAEVNRILGGGAAAPARLSVGVLAQQVINGQWGNGVDRERRITAAGYDYQAVRAEVNRRLG